MVIVIGSAGGSRMQYPYRDSKTKADQCVGEGDVDQPREPILFCECSSVDSAKWCSPIWRRYVSHLHFGYTVVQHLDTLHVLSIRMQRWHMMPYGNCLACVQPFWNYSSLWLSCCCETQRISYRKGPCWQYWEIPSSSPSLKKCISLQVAYV